MDATKQTKNMLKKRRFWAVLIVGWLTFVPVGWALAASGWIFYWDGSYHGEVIDAETKEPIEGAVVVAVYTVSCYRIVQSNSKEVGVQEVLTQADGTFRITSFWTITTPECLPSYTWFKVFKPWYGPYPPRGLDGPKARVLSPTNPKLETFEEAFRAGAVVELPPLKTKEELRLNSPPTPVYSKRLKKKLTYYYKLENEWAKAAGVGLRPMPGE